MKNLVKGIDHKADTPLHKQIEKVLRSKIASGEFDNGKLFPNEVDLSNLFGVSRNTVRQAFNVLVNEGLLQRKQGKGTTVVRNQDNVTHLEEWYSFSKDMEQQGIKIKNYQIEFAKVICDVELAHVFGIDTGREVDKLTRVRGSDLTPFVVFDSWFHPRIPLTENQDFTRPLYEILEADYAVVPMHSSEELKAIIADERLAGLLKIDLGMPVFYRKRLVYDAGMRIIEYNKCYYRHDKMTYKINIKRAL